MQVRTSGGSFGGRFTVEIGLAIILASAVKPGTTSISCKTCPFLVDRELLVRMSHSRYSLNRNLLLLTNFVRHAVTTSSYYTFYPYFYY